jgi:exoribonuclease R
MGISKSPPRSKEAEFSQESFLPFFEISGDPFDPVIKLKSFPLLFDREPNPMPFFHSKHSLLGPYSVGDRAFEGPPPAGFFPGDEVSLDDAGHLTLVSRAPFPPTLVGILDLVSRTRYGFSSRGVPQFLFHPLDPAWPPIIVGSKAATTANQWAVVSTKQMEWTIPKDRWPRANLQELLGPVGDVEVEMAALRRGIRIQPARLHSCEHVATCKTDRLTDREAKPAPVEDWDTAFCIDPPGCRDADDAFAWRRVEGGYEFAIAIANVAACITPELDAYAKRRGQTVYENGVVLDPMLPTELSEGAASLLADGLQKPVVAWVWRFGDGSVGSVPELRWFSTRIHANYTYESVLGEEEICRMLRQFLSQCGCSLTEDSHQWVESAMILYNRLVAHRLRGMGTGLLRSHAGFRDTSFATLAKTTGCAELAFLGSAAGQYVPATASVPRHVGLGEDVYTHATSPLRRYADLVNQRILVGHECTTEWETLAANLNARAKAIKAFERTLWGIQALSSTTLTTAEGWIVGWKEGRVRVYVPAWKKIAKLAMEVVDGDLVRDRAHTKEPWKLVLGAPVQITAFWDRTAVRPEHRFVFA